MKTNTNEQRDKWFTVPKQIPQICEWMERRITQTTTNTITDAATETSI